MKKAVGKFPYKSFIEVTGARCHNLKNINLKLPKNKLVVISGLSGSGKSSLAFDTLYAEGQRRYVESLSAYARQFLEKLAKPDVDNISNLSPAIAIEEKAVTANPRSTVATITEIHDFMRVLFARCGTPHCPTCGRSIKGQSNDEIISDILAFKSSGIIEIFAPLVKGKKGSFKDLFLRMKKQGFSTVRLDGAVYNLDEDITLNKNKKHNVEALVDRFRPEKGRLAESLNAALNVSGGTVEISFGTTNKFYSIHHACPKCGISIGEISPRSFSFNSPYGACPECSGLGSVLSVDADLIINGGLSIDEGAVIPWFMPITTRTGRWVHAARGYYYGKLNEICAKHAIPTDVKWNNLTKKQKDVILNGGDEIEGYSSPYIGVMKQIKERFLRTESDFVREEIMRKYMRKKICPVCVGKRLKKEILAVTVAGLSIADVCEMSVSDAKDFFGKLVFSGSAAEIAAPLLKEIKARIDFLSGVGLDYITLARETGSLARGEAQRIRLATQIGSGLSGVLYVLDEPTIGLHQRDIKRLLDSIFRLRDAENSVCVVEHEETIIRAADWLIDLGPGAGINGGELIYAGPPAGIEKCAKSITGKYLRDVRKKSPPWERRSPRGFLKIKGASQYNLKNIDVDIPLGVFTCVTGVSGSGKSTLVEEILFKALRRKLYDSRDEPGQCTSIDGFEKIDKAVEIDQSPIGRTPRSNPATYTKAWDEIRGLLAQMPLSRARGYKAGQFSFNVRAGRCAACKGDGVLRVEMNFLPDVFVTCDVCRGKRYSGETLEVTFKGKNVYDILEMSISEAISFFSKHKQIQRKLNVLDEVGLGYLKLGQSATTLSGGEAQRVKLSRELSKSATGRTLYFLDEPTTGLHFADIEKLLKVLHNLVMKGNSVIVIEHNLDVIKTADWVIDLGPEGGDGGGRLIAAGTPEEIILQEASHTGKYLKKVLV